MKIHANINPKIELLISQYLGMGYLGNNDLINEIKQYIESKILRGIRDEIIPNIKSYKIIVSVNPEYDYELNINIEPESLNRYFIML